MGGTGGERLHLGGEILGGLCGLIVGEVGGFEVDFWVVILQTYNVDFEVSV